MVCLVYLSSIGSFNTTFNIPWPKGFSAQIDELSIFSFDFFNVLKPWGLCDIDTSFFSSYVVTMAVLPVLCTLLLVAYGITLLRVRLNTCGEK